mgnify:FL=1
MLTDEDIEKCREKATASYKLHYYSTRGQQVTAADDPEMHLIWEVIAACEAKLHLEQLERTKLIRSSVEVKEETK